MWGRNKQLEAVRELGLSKYAVGELCKLAQSCDPGDNLHLAIVSEMILDKNWTRKIFNDRCDAESSRIAKKAEEYAHERRRSLIKQIEDFAARNRL